MEDSGSDGKRLTIVLIGLVLLTLLSTGAVDMRPLDMPKTISGTIAVFIAGCKTRIVGHEFMDLRVVSLTFRLLFDAWLLIVILFIIILM
ncbi:MULTISPECIES: cytochrome C oxidase subunit IV family protein [Sphingobium]|uniref:cytochrome C oxidase subunit IV family protein n=1 Tax=Sphingobium sp. MI1205 TaxID=407020 RepID=UPI00077046AC|nr:cytochrome C oxidase subunit IV family protein [Sphingobium sp. MI1205]AMK19960.1 hypothetical protein K663_17996 [Sphingobium sp. MI1205]